MNERQRKLDEKFHEFGAKYRVLIRVDRQHPHGVWYWDGTDCRYRKPFDGLEAYQLEHILAEHGTPRGVNPPQSSRWPDA